jgi:hypothetical protein
MQEARNECASPSAMNFLYASISILMNLDNVKTLTKGSRIAKPTPRRDHVLDEFITAPCSFHDYIKC